jgi:hypothetical protein
VWSGWLVEHRQALLLLRLHMLALLQQWSAAAA